MVGDHGDTWHAAFPVQQSGAVRRHRQRSTACIAGHMRWLIPILACVGKLLEAAVAVLPDQQMPVGVKGLWEGRRDEVWRWIFIFVGNLYVGGLRADHLVFALTVFGDRPRRVCAAGLAFCEEQPVGFNGLVRRVVKADFKGPRGHQKAPYINSGLVDGVLRPASIHLVSNQNLRLRTGFPSMKKFCPPGWTAIDAALNVAGK